MTMSQSASDLPWLGRRVDNELLKGQIKPRLRALLLDRQWFVVVPVWLAFFLAMSSSLAKRVVIKDIALAQISVASLSFGACVTGLVLSLTLNTERATAWATTRRPGAYFSNLSDLIFVFVWSALCQLAVIFSAFSSLIIGAGKNVYVRDESIGHRVLLAIAVFIATYAFFQLVSVLRSLIQIGVVTIVMASRAHLQKHARAGTARSRPKRRG
jgi:hypothetical protein